MVARVPFLSNFLPPLPFLPFEQKKKKGNQFTLYLFHAAENYLSLAGDSL